MARLTVTWQMCFLYAVGFGGFVAFSVYLPAYLRTAYGLDANDAALRTAGFVVVAVVARPIGGWLSDRIHPVPVLVWSLLRRRGARRRAGLPAARSFHWRRWPSSAWPRCSAPPAGAVFALVGKVAPADKVGAVTGWSARPAGSAASSRR